MKTGKHNVYTRAHTPVNGASEAIKPRSHAAQPASGVGGEQKPTRRDMLRRQMISNRNEKNP